MEEHVWSLVELFISGEATDAELKELAYLLGTHAQLFDAVKEFLQGYKDEDPQITSLQKQELIAKAETISKQFALSGAKGMNGHAVRTVEERHIHLPARVSR